MQNDDDASPSISPTSRGHLEKMLRRNVQTSFRKRSVNNVKNGLTFTVTRNFHDPYLRLEYRFQHRKQPSSLANMLQLLVW